MPQDVEAFLEMNAASGDKVTRIDTHAAIVFLRGDRAIKIKRSIKLPFLDFSTLERRKAACEAELAVNRPYAPTIYRGVVPITRERDGSLAISGTGEPVEWALDMLRFDESATLDKLAERDGISMEVATEIADAIATAHARAEVITTSRWLETISDVIRQNADAFGSGETFRAVDRKELEDLSRQFYARLTPLIRRRNDCGFVRRCHGDLHLANLVLIEGKPVLFDAIEFDERLATTDVMHDLAFTLMDLLHFGCADAANAVLNRYLADTPPDNLEGIGLLPLSISMRAAVRANVLLCRAAQAGSGTGLTNTAKAYFSLARSALKPPPPCLIAVGGLSGTGKTAVARALAPIVGSLPGAVVLRSDVIRKRMAGVTELDRLPPSAYQARSNTKVYAELARDAARVLRQGHSVIVDAVFAHQDERSSIERVAAQASAPFVGLFLTAEVGVRLQRIGQRRDDASDATAEVAAMQERYDLGHLAWPEIDAGDALRTTLKRCKAWLPATSLRRE